MNIPSHSPLVVCGVLRYTRHRAVTTSPHTRVEVAVLGRLDMFSHNQGTTILLRRRASLRVAPLTPCSLLLPTLAKGREQQVIFPES